MQVNLNQSVNQSSPSFNAKLNINNSEVVEEINDSIIDELFNLNNN